MKTLSGIAVFCIISITVITSSCKKEEAPITDFSVNKLTNNVNKNINSYDQSKNNPDSWTWDFGDGETSTSKDPVHKYTSPGTYTVSLTTKNKKGSDTKTKSDYLTVN